MKLLTLALFLGVFLSSAAFAQTEISYDAQPDLLRLPADIHLGEVAGVGANSKGNVFVYTRTGHTNISSGGARVFARGGSRLFEFDGSGKFVRELGEGAYTFNFAESLKVDAQDNVWLVDRGSSSVVKFGTDGRVAMVLGRKPEVVGGGAGSPYGIGFNGQMIGPGRAPQAPAGGGGGAPNPGTGLPGDNFVRPTDVAFDSAGNIFVADGYGNARIAKFDKNGRYLKAWGQRGAEPGQFNVPKSIAVDAAGNVYVADAGNRRIQVFDNEGNFKSQIAGVGMPQAICITPGPRQFLFSSNSNDPRTLDNGEIYKLELNGTVAGKFGKAGRMPKEFNAANEIDCRNPNMLYIAEIGNWRVQRVTLK